jgi:hypothetical protein
MTDTAQVKTRRRIAGTGVLGTKKGLLIAGGSALVVGAGVGIAAGAGAFSGSDSDDSSGNPPGSAFRP